MFSRIRGAAIALGLIVTVGSALAQERIEPALESQPVPESREQATTEPDEAGSGQQEDDAARLLPAIDAIATAIRNLKTEIDPAQRDRQDQREIDDLQAQEDMAFWAKSMFWATALGVGVTAVGVWLIWRTLKQTRIAAVAAVDTVKEARATTVEAKRAADAAFDANNLSRKNFSGQQRAWLDLVDITPRSALTWHHGVGIIELQFNIINVGQSPALNAMIDARVLINQQTTNVDKIAREFVDEVIKKDVPRGFTIFPNKPLSYRHIFNIPKEEADTWIKNKNAIPDHPGIVGISAIIFVVGCIDYELVSNDRRQSGFVFMVSRIKGGIVPYEDITQDELRIRPWVFWRDTITN